VELGLNLLGLSCAAVEIPMLGWGPLPDQSAGDLKIKVAQVILVAVFFERKIT